MSEILEKVFCMLVLQEMLDQNFFKRNEICLLRTCTRLIFVACFISFIIHGYNCFERYQFVKPQAIETSTKFQEDLFFPTLTFCPVYALWLEISGNPRAYKGDWYRKCEIDPWEGKFTGNFEECQDPEQVWKNIFPNLTDFGLNYAFVYHFDESFANIDIQNESLWTRTNNAACGSCYSLNLPRGITKKGIFSIVLSIEPDKFFEIFLHTKDLLDPHQPYKTLQSIKKLIRPKTSYDLYINYQQDSALDFAGKPCETSEDYGYTECLQDALLEVNYKSIPSLNFTYILHSNFRI